MGVAALAVIAAVVLMAQAEPSKVAKVIKAEIFVLRDASAQLRAILGVLADGIPGLELYDEKEQSRAVLGA